MTKPKPLIKSKTRVKALGEVFTPPDLVNEMLDKLPTDLWEDPSKTYIDPACGDGNFLVEVLSRKLKNKKTTKLQALQTTYGVDIQPDNVIECRKRLIKICAANNRVHKSWVKAVRQNIKCANTLTIPIEEIFWEQNGFEEEPESVTKFLETNKLIE